MLGSHNDRRTNYVCSFTINPAQWHSHNGVCISSVLSEWESWKNPSSWIGSEWFVVFLLNLELHSPVHIHRRPVRKVPGSPTTPLHPIMAYYYYLSIVGNSNRSRHSFFPPSV